MRRIIDSMQCGYFFRVFNLSLLKLDYNEKDKGMGKKSINFGDYSSIIYYFYLTVKTFSQKNKIVK